MIRILFTGGGTGGHIYPILAVAEEIETLTAQRSLQKKPGASRQQSIKFKYIGCPGNYQFLLATNRILVSKIISAKWRKYFDLRNFIDIPLFFLSLFQALWKVFWYMPDVLFSKGGPGSLPVILACWIYKIPIIIHESDSVPGLANRLAAKYASRIGVSFESTIQHFPIKQQNKIALIGTPVRKSLLSEDALKPEKAKIIFGFNSQKPLLLILCGSQGARKINEFMINIAGELSKDFQILHQTGTKNFEAVKNELKIAMRNCSENEKQSYKIVPYFDKDLKDAYAAADIIVSRAGSSVFELALIGKPSILIPVPESVVGNHQIMNAYEYARAGAAIVIEEENLTSGIFISQIKKILGDADVLNSMSSAAENFAKPEAAQTIAQEILKLSKF